MEVTPVADISMSFSFVSAGVAVQHLLLLGGFGFLVGLIWALL